MWINDQKTWENIMLFHPKSSELPPLECRLTVGGEGGLQEPRHSDLPLRIFLPWRGHWVSFSIWGFLLRDVWLYVGLYLYHWVLTMVDDFGRILDFVWIFLTLSDYCWLIYFWLYNFDMLWLWPFNGLSFHSHLDTRWYKVVISWAMCSV